MRARRILPLAIGAVSLVGALLLVAWQQVGSTVEEAAWNTVRSASSSPRLLEARLGELSFAPWVELRAARAPTPITARADQLAATAALLERADRSHSARNYRRAAVALLLLDDTDRAIDLLERAIAQSADDALARSDLAAAYLTRAARRTAPWDLARALDAAKRAITSDSRSSEAWFNLALAQQRLAMHEAAIASWRRAATLEAGPWADEALQRIGKMPMEIDRASALDRVEAIIRGRQGDEVDRAVTGEPDLAGEVVERRLLREWAQRTLVGDRQAAGAAARLAAAVAESIRRTTSDAAFADLLASLQSCAERCADGWLHHVDALSAWDGDDYAAADKAVRVADQRFGESITSVNAFRLPVRVTVARVQGRSRDALPWLKAFYPEAVARRYWTLAGRMRWQLALLSSEAGDIGHVLEDYRAAAELLERARDREGSAVVAAMQASEYQQLDDLDRAWTFQSRALRGLDASRPLRRTPILSIAALLASASDLDAAATAFRAPLIEQAADRGATSSLTFMLAEDAETWLKLGYHDRARERLDEANRLAASIDDSGVARMARAVLNIAEGRLAIETDPVRAVRAFDDAASIYRERNDEFATPALQLSIGRALVRAGHEPAAEAAFRKGIDAAERERRRITIQGDRVSALSARWDLYASLADLLLQRDEAAALALLRRARAVNLIEHRSGREAQGTPFVPPAGTLALEFAVLPSGAYGWVTSSAASRRFSVATSIEKLARDIAAYRRAIAVRGDPDAVRTIGQALFDALLGPVRADIAAADRLIVVPDGVLHDVPFAALQDASQHYVIEQAAIVVTPSLELYGSATTAPPPAALAAFVVGNPDRSGASLDAELRALSAAEDEAHDVAGQYPGGLLVTRSQATRATFLENITRARVIHFAGHAVASSTRPEISRLLLAPSSADPLGAVFASDVEKQPLDHVRLVVLSACETASGRLARGEGVVGLVRAFLAAGVPSVVATLWAVDDRSSAQLFASFHRAWARGMSAADALRDAQLTLLHSGFAVADWAGAVVIGQSVTASEEDR